MPSNEIGRTILKMMELADSLIRQLKCSINVTWPNKTSDRLGVRELPEIVRNELTSYHSVLKMLPSEDEFEFLPPPEAPVYEPDEEEWKDPLAYIAKIHPYAAKFGICKIRPPPQWRPPFSVDVEKFRFTPRIQKLNELEAKTRVKLNFIDAIAKFWELQGASLKLPNVDKKPLDLYQLHKIVQEEGGYEDVTRLRRWSRVSLRMGFESQQFSSVLRRNYEKILYPYDVFMSGAMTGEVEETSHIQTALNNKNKTCDENEYYKVESDDNDSSSSSSSKYGTRRLKYRVDGEVSVEDIDYSKNPELKKLQFLAPGPKITGSAREGGKAKTRYAHEDFVREPSLKAIQGLTRRKPVTKPGKEKNIFDVVASWVDDYKCQVCDSGDDEDSMLLCDNCDSSYHTFCLIPPLVAIPPGDWRCPKCVAKECKKPVEAFGFEQAKKVYSLQEFGVMADRFKEEYFSMTPQEVPTGVVEKEFWRVVSSLDDDVYVEYGADLHTAEHGSGFPTRENSDDPADEDYMNSYWNLNNIANHEKCVLRYINADISGMKVPWIYIGMCFSSFCWHTEDHWSYSINYLHWGEPKTWYGVPEDYAEKLEKCIKTAAPELFDQHPDLLHHLVTIISPNTLMKNGVALVRTNQCAGEFVVTFPRAYHAGFNQGFNCAEAVNFCPADWLATGWQCVEHYRMLHRAPVFSHEELVCKMATIPDMLELDVAKKVYENMLPLVTTEIAKRKALHQLGIQDRQREAYELIPDDERQCYHCKTTLFFSAVVCACDKERMACLDHVDEICVCQNYKKLIKYRYTLEEIPVLLESLKKRADSFDNWERKVTSALSKQQLDEKLDISALKEMISEAEHSQYPKCDLLSRLRSAVAEAEHCAHVAQQLLIKKHKTRKTAAVVTSTPAQRLSLQELKDFVQQVEELPCSIKEMRLINGLLSQVESFRYDAKCLFDTSDYDESKLVELLEHADNLEVDLPEVEDLRMELKAARWLDRIEEVLGREEPSTLDVIRDVVDEGSGLKKKPAAEKPLSRLTELLYAAERWEEKAKLCLQAKARHMMGTLEVIVQEASKVHVVLPNVIALTEALRKAKQWCEQVEKIQSDDYYPYYDILEALVVRGRPIPVRLEQLTQMESQVAAARAWTDRTSRTFLKKGSNLQLLEILRPRKDVGSFHVRCRVKKKKLDKEVQDGKAGVSDIDTVVKDEAELDSELKARLKQKKKRKDKDVVDASSDGLDVCKVEPNPGDVSTPDDVEDRKSCGKVSQGDRLDRGASCEVNIDTYVPPDPLTVAEALKVDQAAELTAVKLLRQKNLEKVSNYSIDSPYCLCRRPIEGFMIRCSLCLDWYHSSCVVLPKAVNGRTLVKGLTPWGASKEIRYLCPLCQRSRRPRMDTILSLLMSLQKLPVRVPEGEALQFLTERAMNWQDRAKQALGHDRIQKVFVEVKHEVESGSGGKLLPGALLSLTAIMQKFAVNRLAEDSLTNTVASLDVKLETDCASINLTAEQFSQVKPRKEDDADLECTEEMTGSPKNESCSSTLDVTNLQLEVVQSEHSSRAQSPIDVCTPVKIECSLAREPSAIAVARLPESLLDTLQELMIEGDLLEVTLDEASQIWAILQAQRPLMREDCLILDAEYRRKLQKEQKKQRKRKLHEGAVPPKVANPMLVPGGNALNIGDIPQTLIKLSAKKGKADLDLTPSSTSPKIQSAKGAGAKSLKNTKGLLASNIGEKARPVTEDEVDEDDCSAKPCFKPLGEEVEWVQCDVCESWYHFICVGISAEDVGDTYECPFCKQKKYGLEALHPGAANVGTELCKQEESVDVDMADVSASIDASHPPMRLASLAMVESQGARGTTDLVNYNPCISIRDQYKPRGGESTPRWESGRDSTIDMADLHYGMEVLLPVPCQPCTVNVEGIS